MRLTVFSAALLLSLTACQEDTPAPALDEPVVEQPSGDDFAVARLVGLTDTTVGGTVSFRALGNDGVQIDYDLMGVSAGEHGFHIHQNGSCEPDSTGTPGGAAGGHFNPMGSPHGAPSASPSQRHAGDLGNITVGEAANGVARGSIADSVLALSGPTDVIGKAVILHAGTDDLTTQPSGDAGDRVACGVVEAADGPVLPAPAPSPAVTEE